MYQLLVEEKPVHDTVETRREIVAQTATDLRSMALVVGYDTGAEWPRYVSRNRWQALAWGGMTAKLSMWLRHAASNVAAYKMAFEAITGQSCESVPEGVYREDCRRCK